MLKAQQQKHIPDLRKTDLRFYWYDVTVLELQVRFQVSRTIHLNGV